MNEYLPRTNIKVKMHGGAGNRNANLVVGSAGKFEIIEARESDAEIHAAGLHVCTRLMQACTNKRERDSEASLRKQNPPVRAQQALDNTLKGNSIILTEIRLFLSLCFRNHRADASC